jgi:hypothetical protein
MEHGFFCVWFSVETMAPPRFGVRYAPVFMPFRVHRACAQCYQIGHRYATCTWEINFQQPAPLLFGLEKFD